MNLEDIIPNTILISQGVKDFAYTSIDIANELAGKRDIEWDCDALTLNGDEGRIIRRVIPSFESYVGAASVYVPGHAIQRNLGRRLDELKRKDNANYVISGIMHSHAGFPSSFSPTDHTDFSAEGPRIAADNLVFHDFLPFNLFENAVETQTSGRIRTTQTACDYEHDPKMIETFPDNPRIMDSLKKCGIPPTNGLNGISLLQELSFLVERKFYEKARIGIAQAVVVDARKQKPFGLIGYHIYRPVSGPPEGCWRTKTVDVETVKVDKDMRFTKKELTQMLEKSLHIDQQPPMPYWGDARIGYIGPDGAPINPDFLKASAAVPVYLDKPMKVAGRFVYTGAAYINAYGHPERRYPHYLATILNELPYQPITTTVRELGQLSDDQKLDELMVVNYDAATMAAAHLLSKPHSAESAFVTLFGAAGSMTEQNKVLEKYIPLFLKR